MNLTTTQPESAKALGNGERIHNPLSYDLMLTNHNLFSIEQWEDDSLTHCVEISPSDIIIEKEDYVSSTVQEYLESVDTHESRAVIADGVEFWTQREAHTALGIINNLVYHLGVSCGSVERNEDDELKVDRQKLLSIVGRDFKLVTALCHTRDYLSQYWPAAFHGINRVREMICLLEDMGLLKYESHRRQGKVSRVYTFLDVPKLLILAEVLESRIGYESLPQHGAGLLQKMFNALFKGWGYRRKGVAGQPKPSDYAESDEVRSQSSLAWRDWVRDAYESTVSGYEAIVKAFGALDSLAVDSFEEIKRLARLGRINHLKVGPNQYEFIGVEGGASCS